jgi:hypothetical protein
MVSLSSILSNGYYGCKNLHKPPMANGKVKRTFVRKIFQKWIAVTARNRRIKTTDAATDGT